MNSTASQSSSSGCDCGSHCEAQILTGCDDPGSRNRTAGTRFPAIAPWSARRDRPTIAQCQPCGRRGSTAAQCKKAGTPGSHGLAGLRKSPRCITWVVRGVAPLSEHQLRCSLGVAASRANRSRRSPLPSPGRCPPVTEKRRPLSIGPFRVRRRDLQDGSDVLGNRIGRRVGSGRDRQSENRPRL